MTTTKTPEERKAIQLAAGAKAAETRRRNREALLNPGAAAVAASPVPRVETIRAVVKTRQERKTKTPAADAAAPVSPSSGATVNGAALATVLGLVAEVSPSGNAMPILHGAWLEVAGGVLSVWGTNLDTEVHVRTPAGGSLAPMVVRPSKLRDVTAKTGAVELDAIGNDLSVKTGGRAFRFGRVADVNEYPEAQPSPAPSVERRASTLATGPFLDAAAWCLRAVSTDVTRYAMASVRVIDGNMVATDSHRLHVAKGAALGFGKLGPVLSPLALHVVRAAVKALGADTVNVVVAYAGDAGAPSRVDFMIASADGLTTVEVVDRVNEAGVFPPYEAIIPKRAKHEYSFVAASVVGTLELVKKWNADRVKATRLNINGKLSVSAKSLDAGDFSEALDLVESDGSEFSCGLNAVYLLDALKPLGDAVVTLRGNDEKSPVVIETADRLAILMPMVI